MKVEMYGVTWCGDCRAARRFLDAHGIEYTEIDIGRPRLSWCVTWASEPFRNW
jgi:arsenate reductase-like glutaredoxin family protein